MVIKKGSFKIDIFNAVVHIYVCIDAESMVEVANKVIIRFKEEPINYPCEGLTFSPDLKGGTYYLFLYKDGLLINTITHETDHLRNYIMDYHSIAENNDSKEASANLNGYINEKVFKFLYKNNFELKY